MTQQSSLASPFGVPLPAEPPRRAWDAAMAQDLTAARTIEVGIPMRDGIELAADVHLPPAADLPAPAIVVGTPYDKSSPLESVRPYRDKGGYVAIEYDVRGRGKSEGDWDAHAYDAPDGHDVVEWVAAQEWCSGVVGVAGVSYSGAVVWATMSERPPHLRAAISTSASGRYMEEVPYTFGCFWLYYIFWFAYVRRRINDGSRDLGPLLETLPVRAIGEELDMVGPTWSDWMEHDTLDEYWRARRWDGGYDYDIPCLHVTGWHDHEDIQGAFHHYEQMMATSPASADQWLLVGPWSHVSCRYPDDSYSGIEAPGAALDMTAIHLRFFDNYLRREQNGLEEEPRTSLYDPGERRWKVRPAWQTGTHEHRLFLGTGGTLAAEPGPRAQDQYRYDPLAPNGLRFDLDAEPWEPPLDLAELEVQPGVVSWTSPALEQALTVHGWGELELFAATDGEDTDWHVKLADVQPDGRSLAVAWGCLRASYGADHCAPAPLTPDQVGRYSIELTPAFHTFGEGHQVRVLLASSDYPWFARNLNRFGPIADQAEPRVATNTIHHGASYPSCLRLPVEDGAR